MRWCQHCRHFNAGWPARCRYCSAGLAGRLCTRNHVNPLDWHLSFCGECGQPLQRICGAGFSLRPYVVAAVLSIATAGLASMIGFAAKEAPIVSVILMLALLFVGFRLAYQVLPPSAQRVVSLGLSGAGLVLRGLGTMLVRTGNKGRR